MHHSDKKRIITRSVFYSFAEKTIVVTINIMLMCFPKIREEYCISVFIIKDSESFNNTFSPNYDIIFMSF